MQAQALGNIFAATLAEVNAKTIDGTVHDMKAETEVDRTADTLRDVRVRTMPTY